MALGSNQVTTTIAGNFIPELWSDEVIGAYKANLVVANVVTKLSHKGKRVTRYISQFQREVQLVLKQQTHRLHYRQLQIVS